MPSCAAEPEAGTPELCDVTMKEEEEQLETSLPSTECKESVVEEQPRGGCKGEELPPTLPDSTQCTQGASEVGELGGATEHEQLQMPSRSVRRKKKKGAAQGTVLEQPETEGPILDACDNGRPALTEEKAQLLAMMTARMHEAPILRHMRKLELRKFVLAVPIEASVPEFSDMLDIMLGMVIHCEATEPNGGDLAFGTVVSPRELADQRGCFRCKDMRPVVVEVRSNRFGDELVWVHGVWEQVGQLQVSSTQARLRQKALLNRLRAARTQCESKTSRNSK